MSRLRTQNAMIDILVSRREDRIDQAVRRINPGADLVLLSNQMLQNSGSLGVRTRIAAIRAEFSRLTEQSHA